MVLFGYHYSVYTRTVRMVLHIKTVPYAIEDIDPFAPSGAQALQGHHPFQKVPVLRADGFDLYETQAILDYLDARYPDPALRPEGPEACARMRQVMGIADSYLYRPLVRQAASQHVFHPLLGEPVDAGELAAGLQAAPRVLDALETLSSEILRPGHLTLADCHLWPMMEYALMVPEIAQMVADRSGMAAWCEAMRAHPAAKATAPDLEALRHG